MARNEKLFWYSLLASFVFLLMVGFANPAAFSQSEVSGDYIIRIRPFGFVPTFAVVGSGTNVIWVNEDSEMKVLTAPGLFGTRELGPGMNFSLRLREPGVYQYGTSSATGIIVVD